MAKKEADFDLYIHDLLTEAGINADTQGSNIVPLNDALKTASKQQTGKAGFPEYVAVVRDFVLVMEDKADRANLVLTEKDGIISQTITATKDYAVNGALFYAKKIIEQTTYKKIFAFGNAGDKKHHILRPLFVSEQGYKVLPDIETFENFSDAHIEEYYKRIVLGEVPPEDIELGDILKKAKELHEYLRNYGGLGEDEKPLVVSAILLALREQTQGFSIEQLTGDTVKTDGAKLYEQLENNLKRANVAPEVKKERVLNQFTLIKDRPQLNTKRDDLGEKTPLKYFAEYINANIFKAVISNSPEDYLGRFYGEFVSYSGGDGQALGVVLTPRHITELFCELVDLKPTDVLFDPCCGTGGFLISGMHKMLREANSEQQCKDIKKKQIYGIEIRDDMFSIATTNMILRGDGQSNLICDDFFSQNPGEIQLKGITVGMMNPPYSQAKSKETANLSELCFVRHLLNCVTVGGRVAVIVPVSAMIGKTKEDKAVKEDILKHHTLEGVISLNKDTFYRVGTVPCIAVFTAGEPHPAEKLSKFINFEDDGFEVKKHLGLVETERAKDKKQYLLDCWRGRLSDYPSSFMVKTTVEDSDEWLHSFYYYNDEIPTEQDFMNSIADYLTFEFNMIVHGRGYLFHDKDGEQSIGNNVQIEEVTPLNQKEWRTFSIGDLFRLEPGKGKGANHLTENSNGISYLGATNRNNAVLDFVTPVPNLIQKGNCIVFIRNGEGSMGYSVYKNEDFIATADITVGYAAFLNQYTGLFITTVADKVRGKNNFNNKRSDTRLKKELLQLPVDEKGLPDWEYMENYSKMLYDKIKLRYLQEKTAAV